MSTKAGLVATFFILRLIGVSFCEEEFQAPQAVKTEEAQVQVPADGTTDNAAAVEATGPVEVGNKICPVSGEKVGEMGEPGKVEYKGKIYSLCCPMCEKDFLKDPEQFIEKLNAAQKQEAQPEANEPTETK